MKRGIYKIALLIFLLSTGTGCLSAQDTVTVSPSRTRNIRLNPLKATMLAATIPGMGQIYSRKYWKVPFVYAGFGALAYAVSFNSSSYNTFIKAYQDFTDLNPETQSYLKVIKIDPKIYDPILFPKSYSKSIASDIRDQLLNRVDYYKRYRDLSYIGIGAWYLLTILDANVDASLFDYDVSENINLSLAPFQFPLYNYAVAGVGLSLKINF
ncbi:MAG TPA: DUF5683 domain-containing protein [Bacteroidales bacterium]|nr:DUF5683 domain-containing protein [Bacteroidales bacterium]